MRDKIEAVLESPGWMRLFLVASVLWALGMAIFGVVMLADGDRIDNAILPFLAAVGVPVAIYVAGRLLAWVIRGFLD